MNPLLPTTIVITASRALSVTPDIARTIVSAVAFLAPGSEVRIRGAETSSTETFVALLWKGMLGMEMAWQIHPFPHHAFPSNFHRDRELVEAADRVIAFFDEKNFMAGGTGHVVQCALDKGIPVEVWAADTAGALSLVAEDDNGVDHTERWLRSRAAADLVQAFRHIAELVRTFGPFLPATPHTASANTVIGFGSTALTGGAKSLAAFTRRGPSGLAAHLPSHPSSSLTSGGSNARSLGVSSAGSTGLSPSDHAKRALTMRVTARQRRSVVSGP